MKRQQMRKREEERERKRMKRERSVQVSQSVSFSLGPLLTLLARPYPLHPFPILRRRTGQAIDQFHMHGAFRCSWLTGDSRCLPRSILKSQSCCTVLLESTTALGMCVQDPPLCARVTLRNAMPCHAHAFALSNRQSPHT